MSDTDAQPAAVLEVLTPPAGCTISAQELATQRDRLRALAPFLTEVARANGVLELTFADDIDRSFIDELIAVEERCCSFLGFAYEDETHRPTITANAENEDALDHFVPHRDS